MTEQIPFDFNPLDPRIRAFLDFHDANPHVYELFERFALEAHARRRRFSAHMVVMRIRWFTQIETDDPAWFKVNNNWFPYYARLFLRNHPDCGEFFELRAALADKVPFLRSQDPMGEE